MVRIYYTSFHQKLSASRFDYYLGFLPDPMKHQVLRYRRWEDSHACLFGKLLLRKSIHEHGGLELANIRLTKYGKPFIEGNVSFSISHSGAYVICAISNLCRVGLDIEQVRNEINIDEFRNQFFDDEWNAVATSADSRQAFYALWTSKEAVIKADGRGLGIINQTKISAGIGFTPDDRWILNEINLDENYVARLATSAPMTENIILEELSFQ